MLQPALLSLASVASQCPKLSLAVPARDAANTLQASLSGWSVPQVEWRASSYCSKAVDAFQSLAKLTRTPCGLQLVRTGYAYQPPVSYRRRRAACPQGPVYCTYWVRVTSLGRTVRTAYRGNPGGSPSRPTRVPPLGRPSRPPPAAQCASCVPARSTAPRASWRTHPRRHTTRWSAARDLVNLTRLGLVSRVTE